MQMTEEEIYRDWKQAKYKTKQIGVLADLNQCKRADIEAIIRAHEAPEPFTARVKPRIGIQANDTPHEVIVAVEERIEALNVQVENLKERINGILQEYSVLEEWLSAAKGG